MDTTNQKKIDPPQKAKMLLITNGFPFGESERGFLPTEFDALNDAFDVYVLAKTVDQPEKNWKDLDKERVYCTGNPPLHVLHVFSQIFRWGVIREICRAIRAGGGVRLLLRRISAILRCSARAEMYAKQIQQIGDKHGLDMIYTYWCTQATIAALRVKRKHPEIKVVTRFHGYDLYQERTEELWQPFQHDVSVNCDLLVFACQTGMAYFKTQWKDTPEEKMLVSYLGCRPMERILPANGDGICLVSCSNLIPLKRVEYIVDALALLPESIQVSWHHFGDGILRNDLETRAKEKLSGKPSISWCFHGAVPNAQLDQYYRTIKPDVFITTSSTEGGAPVSIQEALAMGIPAIGTDVGGVREVVISEKTGWLLPGDPTIQQVADAIFAAATLPEDERQDLRKAAFAHWQNHFNSKQTAYNFVKNLEKMQFDGKESYK